MMMTTRFNSFDASPLGAFVESPLGARNAPSPLVYVGDRWNSVDPRPTGRPIFAALNANDLSEIVVAPREIGDPGAIRAHVGGDEDVLYVTTHAEGVPTYLALDPKNDFEVLRTGHPPDPRIPISEQGRTVYIGVGALKGTARTVWARAGGFLEPQGITLVSQHLVELNPETFEVLRISRSFAESDIDRIDGMTGGDNRLWITTLDNLQTRTVTLRELSIGDFRERRALNVIRSIPFRDQPIIGGRRPNFGGLGGGDGPLWLLTNRRFSVRPVEAYEYNPDTREVLQGPVRIDTLPGLFRATTIGGP